MKKTIWMMIFISTFSSLSQAQFVTIGSGILVSERPLRPIAELNVQTPTFLKSRAYLTLSWTDESFKPTIIAAIERSVLQIDEVSNTSIGVGLLLIEPKKYEPDLMFVTSTVVPISIPNTSLVLIGSTLPFEKFDWSVVLKVGWAFWFKG